MAFSHDVSFPPFSFQSLTFSPLLHVSDLLKTASKKEKSLTLQTDSSFFPTFSKQDEILATLYSYGICDEEGNPLPPFDRENFSPLSFDNEEDNKSMQIIMQYLKQTREMRASLPASLKEKGLQNFFKIKINLNELFCHLLNLKSASDCIEEIEFIGRSAIGLVNLPPFYRACLEHFKVIEEKEPDCIRSWFQDPSISQFFCQTGSDDDFRFPLTHKACTEQGEKLILETLNQLGQTLKDFSKLSSDYVFALSKIKEYYTKLDSLEDIKRVSMKEFGGISKWTTTVNPHVYYSTLGIRTYTKDIDLMFVHYMDKRHLFSTDCLK